MERSEIKVLILAGGLGTRIRPLFTDCPKSMIPFNGKPFLEIQMEMLADQGFSSFVLCIGHRAEQIVKHFGDGQSWGWQITYSREPEPLGTGGALRYAEKHLTAPFLLMNGDTYLSMDYGALVEIHQTSPQAVGTITLCMKDDTQRYGQVVVNHQSCIQEFREKQTTVGPGWVNAGVYIFEPHILHHIPAVGSVSLERDVFPALISADASLYAYKARQTFIDIGTPEGYRKLLVELE